MKEKWMADTLRAMREDDLDAVLAVQAACYPPAMQEAAAVVLGKVTPLDAPFALPEAPDTLYVHDLAVAPRALGRGLARRLLAQLLDGARARGLRHSALVSVQGSQGFWAGLGYGVDAARPRCAALASYPGEARYMCRPL
jgi:ribosomal protein S18 acetylase RimI-like enzyme